MSSGADGFSLTGPCQKLKKKTVEGPICNKFFALCNTRRNFV